MNIVTSRTNQPQLLAGQTMNRSQENNLEKALKDRLCMKEMKSLQTNGSCEEEAERNRSLTAAAVYVMEQSAVCGDIQTAAATESAPQAEESGAVAGMKQWYEKLFEGVGAGVKEAWETAGKKVGADGSGFDESGKLTHIPHIMVDRLLGRCSSTGSVLGSTVESAYAYAKHALEEIEWRLSQGGKPNEQAEYYAAKEREFYQEFMKQLESMI